MYTPEQLLARSVTSFSDASQYIIDIIKEILALQYSEQQIVFTYFQEESKNWQNKEQALKNLRTTLLPKLSTLDQKTATSTIEQCEQIIHLYNECNDQNDQIAHKKEYHKQCVSNLQKLIDQVISYLQEQQQRIEKLAQIKDEDTFNKTVEIFLKQDFEKKNGKKEEFDAQARTRYDTETTNKVVAISRKYQLQDPAARDALMLEQKQVRQQREEEKEKHTQEEVALREAEWRQQTTEEYQLTLKLYNINLQLEKIVGTKESENLLSEKFQLITKYHAKIQEDNKQLQDKLNKEQTEGRKPDTVTKYLLVQDGILTQEQAQTIYQYELLATWDLCVQEGKQEKLKRFFKALLDYYPKEGENQDGLKGCRELSKMHKDSALYVLDSTICLLLENKQISPADLISLTNEELEELRLIPFNVSYVLEDYLIQTANTEALEKLIEDPNRTKNKPIEISRFALAVLTNNSHKIAEYKSAGVILDRNSNITLLTASEKSDIIDLKQLLSILDLTTTTAAGRTILHIAGAKGNLEVVKEIIQAKKVPVDAQDVYGNTALHLAANTGHLEIVKELIPHSDVKAKNDSNNTALHLAAAHGHTNIVKELIPKSDVNARNNSGNTALHLAAESGHANIVKELIAKSDAKTKDYGENTPLHLAAKYGYLEIVKALIPKSDVNARNNNSKTPLHLAAESGYLEIAKELIPKSEVNAQNKDGANTALHLAAKHGYLEIVQELIPKSDVNARNNNSKTPLHLAVERGHLDVVRELILPNSNVMVEAYDIDDNTALHLAAKYGHLGIVQELIPHIDINAKNEMSNTALHLAAKNNNLAIVTELIKSGANINAINKGERTRDIRNLPQFALSPEIIEQNPEMIFQAVINNMCKYLPPDPTEQTAILAIKLNDMIKELNKRRDFDNPIMSSFIKMFDTKPHLLLARQLARQVPLSGQLNEESTSSNRLLSRQSSVTSGRSL